MGFAKLALTGEQPALEAGHGSGHFVVFEQPADVVGRSGIEIGFQLAEPQVDRAAFAGGVIFDVLLEGSVQRANLADGWDHWDF